MSTLAAKRKKIIGAAYLYLTLPICIFFIGWVKLVISVPMTLLFLYGAFLAIRNFSTDKIHTPAITAKQFWIVAVMIVFWVLLAGVGGFLWQNRYDHALRNAVFQDLVNFDWPVINETTGHSIAYYLGFWLPAALVGKVLGIEAGYIAQYIWALIGTGIAFCLISYLIGKFSMLTMLLFIGFSGLDIIPYLINGSTYGFSLYDTYSGFGFFQHMELEFTVFNSSCNTSLLFWLYNYAVPFWVCFLLILLQRNNKSLLFTYSLMALFAPIPMVGTAPAVVYLYLHNEGVTAQNFSRKIWPLIKSVLSVENLVGLMQMSIIVLYLATNINVGKLGFLTVNLDSIKLFLYFFMVEFGVYLLVLFPSWIKNKLLITLMISTAVFNFVQVGISYDFAWRASIPFMFFLMLFLIRKLVLHRQQIRPFRKALIILVLLVGAVTPFMEIGRAVYNSAVITLNKWNPGMFADDEYLSALAEQPYRSDYIPSFVELTDEEYLEVFSNFIGTTSDEAFFNKYLEK